MPCVVPTCAASVGTFKVFPRHKSLSERWLDAIHIGCGDKVADDGHLGQMEICQWHFGKPDNTMPYQEPKIFVDGNGEDVEIESCRLCLRFYPSCELVSKNGKLGGIDIKSNVYESLRIAFLVNDFLDLVCTQCIARVELLKAIQKDFVQTEIKFQQLIKFSRQPLVEVIVDQEQVEVALEPADLVIKEFDSEIPTEIFEIKKDETEERFVTTRTYWMDKQQPDKEDISLREIVLKKCYICSTVLPDANELALHLTENHSTKSVYRCEECSLDIPILGAYNRHLSKHDQSERPLKCNFCTLRFKTYFLRGRHESRKHRTNAKVDQPTEKPRPSLVCEICGKSYPFLKKHIQSVHSEDKPSCNICGKTFTTNTSLERHMLLHTNEKPYSCDKCEASFRRLLLLKQHVQKVHEGKNPHTCVECNQEFNSPCGLYTHKRTVHLNKTAYNTASVQVRCILCNERNASVSDLVQHIQRSHGNEIYPYAKCAHCPRSFITMAQLAAHKEIHSDKFACKQCGKRHKSNYHLQIHMDSMHSDGTRHICTICNGKTFKNIRSFQSHMRTHTQDKRHACDSCDKTFHRRSGLVCHRRVHTGEKPYECKYCLRRFSDCTSYRKHEKRCAAVVASKTDKKDEEIDVLMNLDV
ncbi:zinc finger protein 502-like [Ochlerotatus camptorhynchus]|uniref:zinc finger protein 502-like n=1 Tax=Ochlerotatus camptorhynchus TaxID=644619 RepID=UPI0031D5DFAF